MKQLRFFSIIGMAGVSPHENAIARKWAARFDVALIPIAFIALLAWYDNKHGHTMMTATFHSVTDWAMCSFFLTELLWISYLCGDRWRYLKYNWFNLIVLIVAIPIILHEQKIDSRQELPFLIRSNSLTDISRIFVSGLVI